MEHNVYLYILIMAAVSFLIRVLPLTLIRREIRNRTVRSFLYYVPYTVLAVMTVPGILYSTGSIASATAGALGMAWAICKSVDGIARQPEAEGKIRTTLMLGLVFVETAIIYALVIGILIIFVL